MVRAFPDCRAAGAKQVWVVDSSFLPRQHPHFWSGFGGATVGELLESFRGRILLNENEIRLGERLWQAYKNSDPEQLTKLSAHKSAALSTKMTITV